MTSRSRPTARSPCPDLSITDVIGERRQRRHDLVRLHRQPLGAQPARAASPSTSPRPTTLPPSPTRLQPKSLTSQTIPAGSSSYSFSVLVNGDTPDEADETLLRQRHERHRRLRSWMRRVRVRSSTTTLPRRRPHGRHHLPGQRRDRLPDRREPDGHVQRAGQRHGHVVHAHLLDERDGHTAASAVARPPSRSTRRPTSSTARPAPLTVLASQVSDQDGNDPPDNMVVDFVVGFTPTTSASTTYTPIYAIQGSGLDRRDHRQRHARRASSSATSRARAAASGFYLQDLTGDGDAATSDGIFVFTGSAQPRQRRPGRPGHRLRPRALQPDHAQRLEQQHRRRPGREHRPLRHRRRSPPTDVDDAVRRRQRPRALRGHARPLPAAARHRRVLQLRPLRRDRPRPAARRRGPAVHRHRDRRAGRRGERPHRWRTACSRITLDDDVRAPRTRRSCATRTAQPFSLDQPLPRRRHRRRTRSASSASTSASTASSRPGRPTTRRSTRGRLRPSPSAARSASRR